MLGERWSHSLAGLDRGRELAFGTGFNGCLCFPLEARMRVRPNVTKWRLVYFCSCVPNSTYCCESKICFLSKLFEDLGTAVFMLILTVI